jgi:hypothetical protein
MMSLSLAASLEQESPRVVSQPVWSPQVSPEVLAEDFSLMLE